MIDAIIPYVDGSDPYWIKDFSKATGQYNTNTPRFRSWGTLKYLMRGIATDMSFIDRIVLIVARESQIPSWINRDNVRIVLHKDFIPKEFLPTFNSCTIESFLYRIPDLSEKFIYFNDDMFPINKLELTHFFEGDTPCIKFNIKYKHLKSVFRRQCRGSLNMIASYLNLPAYPMDSLLMPEHSLSSMLKSSIDLVGNKCEKQLCNSITLLRHPKNLNQYIYLYYHYFTEKYVDSKINYYYTELNIDMSLLKDLILGTKFHVICINDSDKTVDYKKTKQNILTIFEEKFPNKCKYEI